MQNYDDLFRFLAKECPETAEDIFDSFTILYSGIDDALTALKDKINEAMSKNDFTTVAKYTSQCSKIVELVEQFKSLSSEFEGILKENGLSLPDDDDVADDDADDDEDDDDDEEDDEDDEDDDDDDEVKTDFASDYIKRIEQTWNTKLVKYNQTLYRSFDKSKTFMLEFSKSIPLSDGSEKYLFTYSPQKVKELIDCKNKYAIFACSDETVLICLPIDLIEKFLKYVSATADKNGNIEHYHMAFIIEGKRKIKWLLTGLGNRILDVTSFLI